MNTILQRACSELVKENPDIAYVRGMLETLLEMIPAPQNHGAKLTEANLVKAGFTPQMIEGIPPTMSIDKIKAIADASAE